MRYLYAEDNPSDADLLRTHFRHGAPDVQVELVRSGRECLQRLGADAFDLLLLDNHLPDMDGLDLLRELRSAGQRLPVVLITGAGDDTIVWRALQEGADDYVPKSADYLDSLPALLARVVLRHRSRDLLAGVDGPSRCRNVLYVEPNTMDAELTAAEFARSVADLQLHIVTHGDHALSRLSQDRSFDLVVTDLRLPGMTALELMREVARRGIDIPFVVITGRGDEPTAVALLRLGAYDYIVKRDNYLVQLPHAMRHALQRFRLDSTARALQGELVALNTLLERKVAERTHQLQAEVQARLWAQQELQRSTDLLRMAGRMARLGAWSLDVPTRRLVWSDELATICGLEALPSLAVSAAIRRFSPPGRDRLRRCLDACIRYRRPFDEEARMSTARGRSIWVRIVGQPVQGPAGDVVRVQGALQDITACRAVAPE